MDPAFFLLPSVDFYSQFLLLATEIKEMCFAFFHGGVISSLHSRHRLGVLGENPEDGVEG